ncbi:hypothetical protein ABB37_03878 [Leptomonas pyrrhocoris]|uniref:Transmembrane protein n=1 Tax=Leptomonas pyrrhocoris TaxID=157538 RepID=A0A0M9G3K1_LEPPY|nr:hypothetical protein ABB37_03878 [Leptomonas pyrrhocoris]KPA81533.1 hypothetical protein ABB37_03878 [Leptomonas pyrrhocoris]|eukprot:XP_015659972.1 hypothetical protein ABB37_03878 [Leptomonas pyrrhocoris]
MGRGARHITHHRSSSTDEGMSESTVAHFDAPAQQTLTHTGEGNQVSLTSNSEWRASRALWKSVEACVTDICYTIEDRFILPQSIDSVPLFHSEEEEDHMSVAALIGHFMSISTLLAFMAYLRRLSNLMNGASPVMGEILFCVSHLSQVTQEQLGWSLFCSGFLSTSEFDVSGADGSGAGVANGGAGAGTNGVGSNAAGSQGVRRQALGGAAMGRVGGGGGANSNLGGRAGGGAAGYAGYSGSNVMRYLLGRKPGSVQRQESLRSYSCRSFYSPAAFLVEQACWFIVLIFALDTVPLQRLAVASFFGNAVGWVPVYSAGTLAALACALLFVFMYWIPSYEVDDAVLSVLLLRTPLHHIMSAYCASLCVTLLFAESMLLDDLRRTFVEIVFSLPQRVLRMSGSHPVVAQGLRVCGEVQRSYFYFVDFYFFLGMMLWFALVLLETAAGISILGITSLLLTVPWLVGGGWTIAPGRALKETVVCVGFYAVTAVTLAAVVPSRGIPFLSNAVQAAAILLFMVARCEHKQPNGCAYVLIWIVMLAVYLYEKTGSTREASGSVVWGPNETTSRVNFAGAAQVALQDHMDPEIEAATIVRMLCTTLWQLLSRGLSEEGTQVLHFNVVVLGSMLLLSTSVRAVAVEGIDFSPASPTACATATTATAASATSTAGPISSASSQAVAATVIPASAPATTTAAPMNSAGRSKNGASAAHGTKTSPGVTKSLSKSGPPDSPQSANGRIADSSDAARPGTADTCAETTTPAEAVEEDSTGSEESTTTASVEENAVEPEKGTAAVAVGPTRTADREEEKSAPAGAPDVVAVEGEIEEEETAKEEGPAVSNRAEAESAETAAEEEPQVDMRAVAEVTKAVARTIGVSPTVQQQRVLSPLLSPKSPKGAAEVRSLGVATPVQTEVREVAVATTECDSEEKLAVKVLAEVNGVLENASLATPVSQSNESTSSPTNPDSGQSTTRTESKTSLSSFTTVEKKKGRHQRDRERKALQRERLKESLRLEAEASRQAETSPVAVATAKLPVVGPAKAPATVVSAKAPAPPLPRSQTEGFQKSGAAAAETTKLAVPSKTEKKSETPRASRASQPEATKPPAAMNGSFKATSTAAGSSNASGSNERKKDNSPAAVRAAQDKKQENTEFASGKNKTAASPTAAVAAAAAAAPTTSKETAKGSVPAADGSRKTPKSSPPVVPFPLPKPRHEQAAAAKAAPVPTSVKRSSSAAATAAATPAAAPTTSLTAAEKLRRSATSSILSGKEAHSETSSAATPALQTPATPKTFTTAASTSTTANNAAVNTAAAKKEPPQKARREVRQTSSTSVVDAASANPQKATGVAPQKPSITQGKELPTGKKDAPSHAVTKAAGQVEQTKTTSPASASKQPSQSAAVKTQPAVAAEDPDESYDLNRVLNFLKLKSMYVEDEDGEGGGSDDSNRGGYHGETFFKAESPTAKEAEDACFSTVPAQATPGSVTTSIGPFSTVPQPSEHVTSLHNTPRRLVPRSQSPSDWAVKTGEGIYGDVANDSLSPGNPALPGGSFHVFSTHPQGAAAAAAAAATTNTSFTSAQQTLLPPPPQLQQQQQQRLASPNTTATVQGNRFLHPTQVPEREGVFATMTAQPMHAKTATPPAVYYQMPQQTSPSPVAAGQAQQQQSSPFSMAMMTRGVAAHSFPEMTLMNTQQRSPYTSDNSSDGRNSNANCNSMLYAPVGGTPLQGSNGGGADRQQTVFSRLRAVPDSRGAMNEPMVMSPSAAQGNGTHILPGQPSRGSGPGPNMAQPMMMMMANSGGQMSLFPVVYSQPVYVMDSNGMMRAAQVMSQPQMQPHPQQQQQLVYQANMTPSGAVQRQPNVVAYQTTPQTTYSPSPPSWQPY